MNRFNYTPPTNNSSYENPINTFFDNIKNVLFNQVAIPIAMFILWLTLGGLLIASFGKDEYFGDSGKIIVGILVPLLILLCLIFKRFGNFIFYLWIILLYLILIVIPLIWVTIQFAKPLIEYLS